MSRYSEIYKLISKLYENRRYKEVIDKVNKYVNIGFENDAYAHNLRFLRAKSLRYLGNFEDAIKELKELSVIEKDRSYSKLELFYIYYFLNRYEDAIKLLPELYLIETKHVSNHTLLIAELVMKKQLGMKVVFKRGTKSDYVKEQIINFNEEKALEHIKSHKIHEDAYVEHSRFNDNVNLDYLIECVKRDLKGNKKANIIDILEIHYFAVPGIGYDTNNLCNYIKVVVVPNTTNIISLYPYTYIEVDDISLLNCDLNKLFNREKNTSRIDRFNNRFNLK